MHTKPRAGWPARALAVVVLVAGCAAEEAPPESEPPAPCAADELLEGDACVSDRCGVGAWGNLQDEADASGGPIAWVLEGSEAGDGSFERPFGRIQAAAEHLGEAGGGLVLVGTGTYVENLSLGIGQSEVDIVGRCAARVTVDGSGADEPAVAIIPGVFGLSGMTIVGGHNGIEIVNPSLPPFRREVVLRDLIVEDVLGAGIIAAFAVDLLIEDSIIRRTVADENPWTGRGLDLEDGAQGTVRRVIIEDNMRAGVFVGRGGARLDIEDSVVRNTRALFDPFTEEWVGEGLIALVGATLVGTNLLVEDNDVYGVNANHEGTVVELDGCTIRGNGHGLNDGDGRGIRVGPGVRFTGTNLLIEDNAPLGLGVEGIGADATLSDSTVRATTPEVDRASYEISVAAGGHLLATGVDLEPGMSGVIVLGPDDENAPDSTMELVDSHVVGGPSIETEAAVGLRATGRARLETLRVVVEGTEGSGVVSQLGADVTLVDSVVRDVLPTTASEIAGVGVGVSEGARLVARNTLVERTAGAGFGAAFDGSLELYDVDILDFRFDAVVHSGGAVELYEGSNAIVRGLHIEGGAVYGLLVADSDLDIEDALVSAGPVDGSTGVLSPCAWVWGEGSTLVARELVLEDCENTGLGLQEGATADLRATTIRGTSALLRGGGIGIFVNRSTLVADGLLLEDNTGAALLAAEIDTSVQLTNSTIRGTRAGIFPDDGIGIAAEWWAVVDATDVVIEDNAGAGIYVFATAVVSCEDCTVQRNGFAGAVATSAGTLDLRGGQVVGNVPAGGSGGGVGVFGWDIDGAPAIHLEGVTIRDHPGPGAYLRGRGTWEIVDSVFEDNGAASTSPAGSVAVLDSTDVWSLDGTPHPNGLRLAGNGFSSGESAPVLLHGSTARFEDNTFSDGGDWDVHRQGCGDVEAPLMLDGDVAVSGCDGFARETDPRLGYFVILTEPELVE